MAISSSNSKKIYASASSTQPFTLAVSFTEDSTSLSNNTSVLSIEGSLKSGGVSFDTNYNNTLALYWHDNHLNTDKLIASINIQDMYYNQTSGTQTVSGTYTATHNDDGSLSGYAKVVWTRHSSNASVTYVPASSSISTSNTTLTRLARASVLGAISDFTIGNAISIPITKYLEDASDTLTINLNDTTVKTVSGVDDGENVTFTSSELSTIYGLLPNTNEGTFTFTLSTKYGVTLGTSTQTAKGTIPDSIVPTITSVTIKEENVEIPSEWGVYVQNKTELNVVTNASGGTGASVTSVKVTVDDNSYVGEDITTNVIKDFGTLPLTVLVTDSRGRTATYTQDLTVYAYSTPSVSHFKAYRSNASGTEDANGTYVTVEFVGTTYSVNSKNTYGFEINYKRSIDEEYTTYEISASDYSINKTVTISGISLDYSYEFIGVATDYFTSTNSTPSVVSSAKVTVDYLKGGNGMAVGKVAEKEGVFECAFEFQDRYGNTIDGPALVDLIYPVGSIYMSVNAVNPSTLFGGTWEQLKDRFLLGAGDTYSNGATGGEATHTLTVDEMPAHTHEVTGETNTTGAHVHSYNGWYSYGAGSSGGSVANARLSDSARTDPFNSAGDHKHTVTGTASSTGGGKAHNNLPPYLVVNIWKRTA